MRINIDVSEKTEGTESPFWLILDPAPNMRRDINQLAGQITGLFFSREEAEGHLKSRAYAYSPRARVYCFSGFRGLKYRQACREATEEEV